MSELTVGTISGLAANDYVVSVAAGSTLIQPGAVLQVVQGTSTSNDTTTADVFVDTSLSVTITPKSASNKVYIFANFLVSMDIEGVSVSQFIEHQITDSSNTAISGAVRNISGFQNLSDTSYSLWTRVALIGYDSPGSTSAKTYKLRQKAAQTGIVGMTAKVRGDIDTAQLIAIEVGA